jgi:hypothetical protein
MCRLGEEGVAKGKLESMTVSHITQRKFVVLPGKETPPCMWKESGETVEYLAALKIVL